MIVRFNKFWVDRLKISGGQTENFEDKYNNYKALNLGV